MDVVTTSLDRAGVRKAAVFIASLDPAVAEAILKRLPPEQAEFLREAATILDALEPQEQQRVVDEFRRIEAMRPDASPPGIELCGLPVEQPERADAARATSAEAQTVPFGFLVDADDDRLGELLTNERPPTVALVLSHLPPERAGEVLASFEPAVQAEIVRRLADIEKTDPETVREIERALESRWSRQSVEEAEPAADGPDVVARILAACDRRRRGRILENLAASDPELAEHFGHRTVAFDDVVHFDDATLAAVVEAAEPEVLEAALFGAPARMLERLLRCMTAEKAKCLRYKLNHPDPIRLSDVEEARRRIASLTQQLASADPPKTSYAA